MQQLNGKTTGLDLERFRVALDEMKRKILTADKVPTLTDFIDLNDRVQRTERTEKFPTLGDFSNMNDRVQRVEDNSDVRLNSVTGMVENLRNTTLTQHLEIKNRDGISEVRTIPCLVWHIYEE